MPIHSDLRRTPALFVSTTIHLAVTMAVIAGSPFVATAADGATKGEAAKAPANKTSPVKPATDSATTKTPAAKTPATSAAVVAPSAAAAAASSAAGSSPAAATAPTLAVSSSSAKAKYVIQISVDGTGSFYVQHMINEGLLPNFKRFQTEGATTGNARTDYDYTITLPNHTCMLTGRPVMDKRPVAGHGWISNGEPKEASLHSNTGSYIKSTFDVAHDAGLRTALFATKTKFAVYKNSYSTEGAPDSTGKDNGRNKIDLCVLNENTLAMTCQFVLAMSENPANYSFVHFRAADSAGHAFGWGGTEYRAALRQLDTYLGLIFDLVTQDPKLKGKTTILLTADHGGYGKNHAIVYDPLAYTIPFFVWGVGVQPGADLYELNAESRRDPRLERVDYSSTQPQPIRNGDAGNLALSLLGLEAIPGSLINAKLDLRTSKPTAIASTPADGAPAAADTTKTATAAQPSSTLSN